MSKDLEKHLQDQLRASEDGLDAPTLARLHAARNRAVDLARNRHEPRWARSWLTAAAAAGVAAIALSVALRQPADTGQSAMTEFESTLLAAAGNDIVSPVTEEPGSGAASAGDTAETLDLLENLDFYEWLSEEAAGEQQT